MLAPWKESYQQPRQHIKKQRHDFADKVPYSQNSGFSSSHVRLGELDHKESWTSKNWCFPTVVLENPLESPLNSKEIKSVHPKGNQPWLFIGRTDAAVEALILWLLDTLIQRADSLEKTPMLGKTESRKRRGKRMKMVEWHHWLNGHAWVWANSRG